MLRQLQLRSESIADSRRRSADVDRLQEVAEQLASWLDRWQLTKAAADR
jgi:hypothetical protein